MPEKPIGRMIVDLDHFKLINDTHGHDIGDEVLRAVAGCLKDRTRYHDVVARLGGEELRNRGAQRMDTETLLRFAERIRKAVAGMVIQSGNAPAEDHGERRPRHLGSQGKRRDAVPARRPAALPGQEDRDETASQCA